MFTIVAVAVFSFVNEFACKMYANDAAVYTWKLKIENWKCWRWQCEKVKSVTSCHTDRPISQLPHPFRSVRLFSGDNSIITKNIHSFPPLASLTLSVDVEIPDDDFWMKIFSLNHLINYLSSNGLINLWSEKNSSSSGDVFAFHV